MNRKVDSEPREVKSVNKQVTVKVCVSKDAINSSKCGVLLGYIQRVTKVLPIEYITNGRFI